MGFVLSVFIFAFAFWLGLYLIARDPQKRRLRYTGFGLIAYALALAANAVGAFTADPLWATRLAQLNRGLLVLPAVFWLAAAYSLAEEDPFYPSFDIALWALAVMMLLLGVTGGVASTLANMLATVFLVVALAFAWRVARELRSRRRAGVLLTAVLFFTLTLGLIVHQLNWLPRDLLLLTVGFDLPFLGFAVAALDALDEGEALLPDTLRSLLMSTFSILLFGGLVTLAFAFEGTVTFPLVTLLFAVVAAAIVLNIFGGALQRLADRLTLSGQPGWAQAREQLRATAEALPRLNASIDPLTLDEAEFTRLTRRALSHLPNLPRLAASPLTRLPVVETRLRERGAQADTLDRAAELKRILTEGILRLKPDGKRDFGTTSEWRHYNALYFPYVVGLRPYDQSRKVDELNEVDRAALNWFRTEVPERTLHNWQNAAARLIAQQLIESNQLSL